MNGIAYAGEAPCYAAPHADKNFSVIVAKGSCTLSHAGGRLQFGEGTAAVVPPLLRYSLSGAATLVSLEQAMLPFREIRLIRDDNERGLAFAAKQAETYFKAENSTRSGILQALGSLIAAYLAAFAGDKRLSPVVATVRGEIKKNLSNSTFSLEDSIKQLPLNSDYVRKLFKKETGATPHEFLISSRMELAAEIIMSGVGNRYSNYSVGQIAEACGFAEPLYFSRVFKKYFGISPSEACKRRTGEDNFGEDFRKINKRGE